MVGFLEGLRKSIADATSSLKAGNYVVAGLPVKCIHCGGEEFAGGKTESKMAGFMIPELEWSSHVSYSLVCTNCGRIEAFMKEPEKSA